MTGTPHLPRGHRPARTVFASSKCIDCGETDRSKFYRHPTSKTGLQARCKPCDNRKRMGNYRRGTGEQVDAVRQPDGSITLVRRTTQTGSVDR